MKKPFFLWKGRDVRSRPGKKMLCCAMALVVALLAGMPGQAVFAASYNNHDVQEGTELFNIDNTFTSISHSGTSAANIAQDGGWSISYRPGETQNWWIDSNTTQGASLAGRWVALTFPNVGTINGRQVKGVLTISNMVPSGSNDDWLGITRPNIIMDDQFWNGFWVFGIQQADFEVSLYYADDGSQINMAGMYTTIGSLNGDTAEGSDDEAVRYNYGGTVQTYRLPANRTSYTQFSPSSDAEHTGIMLEGEWFRGRNYSFDDVVGGASYLKSAVGFQIPGMSATLSTWSNDPNGSRWTTFNISPFGAGAKTPVKTVEDVSGNDINQDALYPGDTLVYRTNQEMEVLGISGTARYKSFTMTDTVPDGLTVTGVALQQKNMGSNSYTTIPADRYTYQTVGNADGTTTVILTLNNPNSTDWSYAGETLSMTVTCRVEEKMWDYTTFGRNASVSINGNGRDTNSVVNSIAYRILTNVTNGTIDEDITRIIRGTDQSISFKGNDGYYLKSISVDGAAIPITADMASYLFSDIVSNHTIDVVYAKDPVITLTKQIQRQGVVWAKGSPIFTFKISGTDYLGEERTYYRLIAFDETESAEEKSLTLKIPAGQWTVTELATNDWGLSRITAGASCSVQEGAAVLDTRNSDAAGVSFANEVTDYSNYTHNDFEINELK